MSRWTSNSVVEPVEQRGRAVVAQAAHDPVGRQDRERLAGRVEEQRQDVVEGRVLLARPRHPPLVAIAQRRLVAVVAVGDRDRSARGGGQQRRDGLGGLAVGRDRPEPMADVVVVGQVDVGGAAP